MPAGLGVGRQVIVPLTADCNNNCVFCPMGGTARAAENLDPSEIDRVLESECSASGRVCLVGGEPSLLNDLPGLIAHTRALGFRQVLLQTNGRRLAYPKYLRSLIDAGLGILDVSLHGPRAAVHEYHTRAPGSFAQTISGLRAAAGTSLEIGVTTVVTRSNYRHLRELVRLLSYIGVDALHVSFAQSLGNAVGFFPSIVPRLCLAAPHVRAAFELGERLGIFVAVSGLPPCLSGRVRLFEQGPPIGCMGPDCDACAAQSICPGLDAGYADRYGFDELTPMKNPLPVAVDRDDHRSLRFAGLAPEATLASTH